MANPQVPSRFGARRHRFARLCDRLVYARPQSPARRRLSLLLAITVAILLLLLAAPAQRATAATFQPAQVVSYQGDATTEDASDPQIASGGGYVVFDGIYSGVQGVWEKDLASGALNLVAGQQAGGLTAWNALDAGSPSVSADGQYVAFTTTADLDPSDDPQPHVACSNVYVRDMDVPVGSAGAYTLVSALSGSATGLAYALNGAGTACGAGGSASADGVAISADGNEVVFTVVGQSDLVSGSAADPTTPPDQVAVRYLDSDTTTLVSQTMASEQSGATPAPVPGGAALSSNGGAITSPTDISDVASLPVSASTASISADGSTVAWAGIDIPAQAPANNAADNAGGDAPVGYPASYDEPLWRDIAAGSDSPTRRVTGGDDPSAASGLGPFDTDYDPAAGDSSYTGPQFGTYVAPQGFGGFDLKSLDQVTPQLSANGQEVAFLATVPLWSEVPTLGLNGTAAQAPVAADAYVANMAPGLTRDQALTQLTEDAGVTGTAISEDGTKVAFTTAETQFVLAWPALVTPQVTAQSALGASQLYDADLSAGTLSMVTYGYDGNPANGTVTTPSFTADGNTLAFASGATNLVYGVTTIDPGDLTDVFTMAENTSPDVSGTQTISSPPPIFVTTPGPVWRLSVTARTTRTGELLVSASVPGRGRLTARGNTFVPAHAKQKSKLVASAARTIAVARVLTLTLKPAKRYASQLRRRGGLTVDLRVGFAAAGRKTLTQTLQLTLHNHTKVKAAKKKTAKKAKKKATRRIKVKRRASGTGAGVGQVRR